MRVFKVGSITISYVSVPPESIAGGLNFLITSLWGESNF